MSGQRRPTPPPVRPRKGADRKRGSTVSAFIQAANAETAKQCSVAKARAQLDPASALDFDAWMRGELVTDDDGNLVKLTDKQVWNSLQGMNFRVGHQTVGRHRRGQGECGCRP